jgi:uncharacterized hydantoinase/oxoprolinase family protein
MVCADAETFTAEEARHLAESLCHRQLRLIWEALGEVSKRAGWSDLPLAVVVAGSGEFLARMALEQNPTFPSVRLISLAETLGPRVSQAACAYAVARLTAETPTEGF